MRAFLFAIVLAACLLPKAWATSAFGYSGEELDIQFVVGEAWPEFNGLIEVSTKAGPRTLPRHMYTLSNYVYEKSLTLSFTNPGDKSLPPSFILTVVGERATLEMGGRRQTGRFSWET